MPEQLGKMALIVPFLGLELLKPLFTKIQHEFCAKGFFSGFTAALNNVLITVLRSGMGSERVVDAALALHACGVAHIAFAGTAGALHPEIQLGDLWIPDACIQVTLEDLLEKNNIQLKMELKLPQNLTLLNQWTPSPHRGLHASLPSVLLLDQHRAMQLKNLNVQAVDLEAAQLAMLATHLGFNLTIALTVSDLPLTQPLGSLTDAQRKLVLDQHLLHIRATLDALIHGESRS